MVRLCILFQNDGSKSDSMFVSTPAKQHAAYALIKEYIRDMTERNLQFRRFDDTDKSEWIDGTTDPEKLKEKAGTWNTDVRDRFNDSLETITGHTHGIEPGDYTEHAAASCEMANIVIHGCQHVAFIRDEYNCCYMQTMLTPDNMLAIENAPDRFCYLVLEYY